jgi:hypothetical protein
MQGRGVVQGLTMSLIGLEGTLVVVRVVIEAILELFLARAYQALLFSTALLPYAAFH